MITYKLLDKFPNIEKYAMSSQLRRSVVSICANIAEGSGRRTSKDYVQFLHIAKGSLAETKNYFIIANDLHYMNSEEYDILMASISEIERMLNGLINSIVNTITTSKH